MLRTSFIGRPVRKNLAQVIIFGFIIDVCNPCKTRNHIIPDLCWGSGTCARIKFLPRHTSLAILERDDRVKDLIAGVLDCGQGAQDQHPATQQSSLKNAPIMYVKLEKTFILQACRRSRSLIHNFQRQSKDVGQRSHYSMRISEQFCSRRWVSLLWGLHTLDPRLE